MAAYYGELAIARKSAEVIAEKPLKVFERAPGEWTLFLATLYQIETQPNPGTKTALQSS